jgi:endonuclease YncB( thermonuclease family)
MPTRRCHPSAPSAVIARWLRRSTLLLSLAAVVPASGATPPAAQIEGTVTRVTDGDSLWLEPGAPAPPVELRLEGIDAPEICQAWGPEARAALADLVLKKQVIVRVSGRDSHGRTLGTVFLDGLNVNKALVQEGHAWSSRYKYDRGPYVADERMAKALSRGFNREAGAVMPREFRRLNGPCAPADAVQHASGPRAPPSTTAPALAPVAEAFRCDGRTHCSQMRSCAEATFFLKNCPGVKMDGNGDGVPCETQWCRP